MQNKVSVVPEEDLRDYRHCGRKDSYSVEMSLLREDSQAGMADTDLIENEIMFTQNERAAKLRAAKGRSKARDQYLSLLRPFLRFYSKRHKYFLFTFQISLSKIILR